LNSLDGSTKIKENGDLSKLLHEDPNTLSKFFETSLNKGRTMGEGYLSILGTIETSTTRTTIINNASIKKALDNDSISVYNMEFEDTDLIMVSFLKGCKHKRLVHSAAYQKEQLWLDILDATK
jgi:phage portal protein BeeE